MCDTAGIAPAMFCGPGGQCVNSTCICKPGWENDLTIFRQRDCWLPSIAMPIVDGLIASLSLLAFILACALLAKAKHITRIERQHVVFVALGMPFTSAYAIAHLLEGRKFGVAAIVLVNVALWILLAGLVVAAHRTLRPLFLLESSRKRLRSGLIALQVFEFVGSSTILIPAIMFNDDDIKFTAAMSGFLLSLALYVFILTMTFMIATNPSRVRRVAGRESDGLVANENSSWRAAQIKSSSNYVAKIRKALWTNGPVIVVGIIILCSLRWATGSLPILWLTYTGALLHIPVGALAVVIFNIKAEVDRSKSHSVVSVESRATSSPETIG